MVFFVDFLGGGIGVLVLVEFSNFGVLVFSVVGNVSKGSLHFHFSSIPFIDSHSLQQYTA